MLTKPRWHDVWLVFFLSGDKPLADRKAAPFWDDIVREFLVYSLSINIQKVDWLHRDNTPWSTLHFRGTFGVLAWTPGCRRRDFFDLIGKYINIIIISGDKIAETSDLRLGPLKVKLTTLPSPSIWLANLMISFMVSCIQTWYVAKSVAQISLRFLGFLN